MKNRPRAAVSALTLAQLIKYMLESEYTCAELADLTGLHYVTVLRYTRELHRAGAAFISEYRQDARNVHSIKVYSLGTSKDVRRPKMTGAQKAARYRAKRDQLNMLRMTAGASSGREQEDHGA